MHKIIFYLNDNLGFKVREGVFNATAVGVILMWKGFPRGIISLRIFGIINQ